LHVQKTFLVETGAKKLEPAFVEYVPLSLWHSCWLALGGRFAAAAATPTESKSTTARAARFRNLIALPFLSSIGDERESQQLSATPGGSPIPQRK
jgi:hypothetical protein